MPLHRAGPPRSFQVPATRNELVLGAAIADVRDGGLFAHEGGGLEVGVVDVSALDDTAVTS